MAIVISLDVGTTKLCAVAFDTESMRTLAIRSAANDADVPDLPPDRHEQNPVRIRDRLFDLIREVLADEAVSGAEMAGIGICGQMHGVLIVDAQLEPLTHLITWRDQRSVASDGSGTLDQASSAVGDEAARRVGCRLHTGYGGVTLYHLGQRGELPAGAMALSIADFIAASLTGAATTEPTHAASWGLLNLASGQWDEQVIERLGLPRNVLPPVCPTASPIGPLRKDVADSLGLPQTVRVCSPLGDNQASAIGVAGLSADAAIVNLGTGGQVSIPQSHAAWVEGFETRPMPFGSFILVGASLCGGWAYAYLRQFFEQTVRRFADVELTEEQVYEHMNRLAGQASAGTDGLSADTRFAGARSDPHRRGAITGIDTENLTPANLCRAVIEGMVGELADMFDTADASAVKRIIATGNAVRRNPLVVEAIERRFARPGTIADTAEEAATGAALAAAVGLDLIRPETLQTQL